jgi:Ca-activated chloride channel family protein
MVDVHSIRLMWPFMLWSLLLLPVLLAVYVVLDRRSRRWGQSLGVRTPSLGLGLSWRRHAPAVWFAIGLAVLLVALTRPRAVLLLPTRTEAVMLVMDSSGSMRADDVKPSRLHAAQAMAREFVLQQPSTVKLGIVSAAATANVVQGPTHDREALLQAIDRLSLQPGSAMGAGLLIGLSTLLPASGLDVNKLMNPEASSAPSATPAPLSQRPADKVAPAVALEPGSNASAALVMFTDGQSNTGPDLIKIARVVADRGVRVYTLGMGTPEGVVLKAEGFQARVKLDEAPLKQVAEITRGEYFRVAHAQDVQRIYQSISSRIVMQEHQQTEVTALVLGVGMLWLVVGAGWGVMRRGRVL